MKLVLKTETAANIKAYIAKGYSADKTIEKAQEDKAKALQAAIDALYADGIKPEDMKAPKDKEADRSFYASLETAVVSGFLATVQDLLVKDTKTLKKTDGPSITKREHTTGNKRYWQQQIGSKIKDLRNSLQRRIDKANAKANGEAQTSSASWEANKRKALADIINQAKKKESTTIKDLAKFIQDLESALARIPANA